VIVDSSALVALALRQPGFDDVLTKILSADSVAAGAPTLAETGIVLTARLGVDARPVLGRLLEELQVVVVPFTGEHWREAVGAYHRFGKGRHPASLNFGDCLTYAVASLAGEALLAIGDDFTQTDLVLA
jgi:ribonuclease VapC